MKEQRIRFKSVLSFSKLNLFKKFYLTMNNDSHNS